MIEINVSPGDRSAFVVGAILDGREVRFSLRWMPQLGAWFCTVLGLSTEQRVTPGGTIRLDPREGLSPLQWVGPDPYVQSALGATVWLAYG